MDSAQNIAVSRFGEPSCCASPYWLSCRAVPQNLPHLARSHPRRLVKTLETLSRKTRRAAHLAAAVATARAWRRAPPPPPACARTLRTHPQPAPSPDAAVGAGLGFASAYRSPSRGATQTVLSRRASVRGGRCGAANGPFDLLDTAGTARIDASFDRLTSCGNPRFGALEHAC